MRAFIALAGLLVLLPLEAPAQDRSHPTGPHSPRGVAVVDAGGKPVGTVVDARFREVTIALSVNGRRVLLDVIMADFIEYFPGAPGRMPPLRGGAVIGFESRDCSGPPFLFEHRNRLLDMAAIAPPGMTLYLPAVPRAAPAKIVFTSYAGVVACQTVPSPYASDSFVPAVAVVDLLTLFTPPFRLRFVE